MKPMVLHDERLCRAELRGRFGAGARPGIDEAREVLIALVLALSLAGITMTSWLSLH